MVESTPDGHLGRCESCGDRNQEFTGYGEAAAWCDAHERAPRKGKMSRPGLKVLAQMYLDRSTNMVYTPEERAQWKVLGEELVERIKMSGQLPGQIALFDDDEEWP